TAGVQTPTRPSKLTALAAADFADFTSNLHDLCRSYLILIWFLYCVARFGQIPSTARVQESRRGHGAHPITNRLHGRRLAFARISRAGRGTGRADFGGIGTPAGAARRDRGHGQRLGGHGVAGPILPAA